MNLEGGQSLNFAISSTTVLSMLSIITDKTPFGKYPNCETDQSVSLNRDADYQKTLDLMDQGNYDDALQILKTLSEKYPKAAEVYFQTDISLTGENCGTRLLKPTITRPSSIPMKLVSGAKWERL